MNTHPIFRSPQKKQAAILSVDLFPLISAGGRPGWASSVQTVAGMFLIGCLSVLLFGNWGITPPSLAADLSARISPLTADLLADASTLGAPTEELLTVYWDRRRLRRRAIGRGRKVRRTRAEIQQERKELLEKTLREIDAIVAEYHARLPQGEAQSIGAIYARYSSRYQDSIGDQVRTVFEAAYQLGIFIPREHVYFDMAVRGYQHRRPGLTALRETIRAKKINVVLVFTTSRLFRRAYMAQQFVEEELVERGIRAVFVKSGIDTADGDNWRIMFQMLAAMDEAMVRMYGSHIRAAHEGLFIRGMVCTSLPLGFAGEEVPGEVTRRKRPRRRIVVDSEAALWIVKIFEWYVLEGKNMDAIARELNDDPDSPAPAKSLTGLWTHALVRKHLLNPCYRGLWAYGAAETKWSGNKDYAQRVPRPAPLRSGYFENLRIVPDELWYRAQDLLANERRPSGRRPVDGDRASRPRLLNGVFVCPEHGRQLLVSGAYGGVLFCPVCRVLMAEKRPLFSHLNRVMAVRLTCEKLAELVRFDDDLVALIITACQREAEAAQRPNPETLARLRQQDSKLASKIAFNRRNPGDTEEEQAETEKLLRELRAERTTALADLAAYEAAQNCTVTPPTREEVQEMLADLGQILTSAAKAETDSELRIARRIIDELTGGRIEVFQLGERKAQRGWLQGRFKVRLLSFLIERVTGVRPLENEDGIEVVIDYCEPPEIIALSEKAKALYDAGMMNARIAKELGRARSYVTKLLKYWHESRGLVMPDGRSRRATLTQKHMEPPPYQQIADDVMRRYQQKMLLQDIADAFKVDRNTITAVIRWWHESRGLPVPDGRARRKELDVKTSPKNGNPPAESQPDAPDLDSDAGTPA